MKQNFSQNEINTVKSVIANYSKEGAKVTFSSGGNIKVQFEGRDGWLCLYSYTENDGTRYFIWRKVWKGGYYYSHYAACLLNCRGRKAVYNERYGYTYREWNGPKAHCAMYSFSEAMEYLAKYISRNINR